MQRILLLSIILLSGCNAEAPQKRVAGNPDAPNIQDTISGRKPSHNEAETPMLPPEKVYSNARFKEVRVAQIGDHKFRIQGKGQIFEASFNWVVEDGHDELKNGFQMTDAGAPEWGNFDFTLDVSKKRPNSTLHLILFESSAKDGSRQYELPLYLY
jgi:hypothetical protein